MPPRMTYLTIEQLARAEALALARRACKRVIHKPDGVVIEFVPNKVNLTFEANWILEGDSDGGGGDAAEEDEPDPDPGVALTVPPSEFQLGTTDPARANFTDAELEEFVTRGRTAR